MNKECRGPTSLVIMAQMPPDHVGLELNSSRALWIPPPFRLAHPTFEGCSVLIGEGKLETEERCKSWVSLGGGAALGLKCLLRMQGFRV